MKKLTALLAASVLVLAGCVPEETTPPPPDRVAKFTATAYVYETDTDATNFLDVDVAVLMTATTAATGEGVAMFNLSDGTVSDTLDLDFANTPWSYKFYEATEPINIEMSVAVILEEGQTLACHVFTGGDQVVGQLVTLDEAVGPGPAGVTCEFVVF